MSNNSAILAIDQGTTSTRAIVFDRRGRALITAQLEFKQYYPGDGWVEHDPEEIWSTTLSVCGDALAQADAAGLNIAAIGITNQRETTVVWDRKTSKPIHNAIVWQDRRTAERCAELKADGAEDGVNKATGLLLDPYFSGSKIAWILDNVSGAREAANRGDLAFGTTDSFLLWRLTNGSSHVTDATNASRTLLFNIHTQSWDESLLSLLNVPANMLPEVLDCAADFGQTDPGVFFSRKLPICGVAGDQQAASVGQACFSPGMIKSTYGTGCFVLLNTGQDAAVSKNRLLTTVAYRLGGKTTYALEGSIFVAGAAVQWLRDGIGIIKSAGETEALAASLDSNRGVYLVPAFTGLGAPHWDPHARGAMFGLTRDTGVADLVRATLESVCYQTHDLVGAMIDDSDGVRPSALRVDGGMVNNDWLMQTLADIIDVRVDRPVITETTALGAAYLAGLHAGVYSSLEEIGDIWQRDATFEPNLTEEQRSPLITGWNKAVGRVRET